MVDRYAREVDDFRFIPLKNEQGTHAGSQKDRRLRVTIGINGWLDTTDDVTKPWRALGDDSEAFALRYEMKSLLGLGKSLRKLVSSYAWNTVKVEVLKRTVLATLWSALWPAYMLSMASTVDNPFSLAKNRSEKAGEILADALINKVQGERPVTLIGYSLGARVIYTCLRSLAARRAFGLVDSVVFIGAPVPSNKKHWKTMRAVVSGKLFNVYSENDYLLAFLYRATSIQLGVAGLQEIKDIEGVENLNLTKEVKGHMRYAELIPKILARCGIPVVNGTSGLIEEEEDAVTLTETDSNLIDLDGLTITEPAPKEVRSAPPQLQKRTPGSLPPTAQRNEPQTAGTMSFPSGLPPQPTAAQRTPEPTEDDKSLEQSNTKFAMPQIPDQSCPPAYVPSSSAASSASCPAVPTSQMPVNRPPMLTTSLSQRATDSLDDDDDSDEDGDGMGIKMVDNDDGLAHCDPAPFEEEPNRR